MHAKPSLLVGIITAVNVSLDPMTREPRGRVVDVATDHGIVAVRVSQADAGEEFVLRSPAALPVVTIEDPEFGPELHYAFNAVPQAEARELARA